MHFLLSFVKRQFVKLEKRFKSVTFESTEAVVRSCSAKRVFLGISQNSQENTCARVSFLIKLQALGLIKHLWWLLVSLLVSTVTYFLDVLSSRKTDKKIGTLCK